jgi:hypothetical protein
MILKRLKTETIKIKDLFSKLEIKDEENSTEEIKFPLFVLGPYGFKKIKSAFRTERQQSVTTYFKNNKTLKTSENHLLRVNGQWKKVKDIEDCDDIDTKSGITSILKKHFGKEEILYDISVEEVHCYYSNGIVSHNSWALSRFGARGLLQGKNVVHFTLELNQDYVGRRYDSCFTGIDFQEIPKNYEKVKEMVDGIPGKLFIKYFPLKTVSANSLKIHIERTQNIIGAKIDLAIIDYADILKPFASEKNSNSYSEAGNIYEELRSVLGELQIPGWTASQGNRSSADQDIIQAHNVADSYRKIMTADFVMSLSRKMTDKTNGTARFHVIKNRFGPDGMTFNARMNTSNGLIDMYDPDSTEGLEIAKEMGNEEIDTKKHLKNKWEQLKSQF